MKQKPRVRKKVDPLSTLVLPNSSESSPLYPWPLITWPFDNDAIAKLKQLRKEFKTQNPFFANVMRLRLDRRGRPKQSSPLYSEQSFVLAFAHTVLKIGQADLLRALGKDTSPEDYHWLKIRLKRGEEYLLELSPQDLRNWKSVKKATLLAHLNIFP